MDLEILFPKEELKFWHKVFCWQDQLTEVRIRVNAPACVYLEQEEFYIGKDGSLEKYEENAKRFTIEEITKLLLHLCKYSLYAFEDELKEGYITLEGGHRLGVAGQVVMQSGLVKSVKYISSLNLRVCHQIPGSADKALPLVYKEGSVRSTLIISPPGYGKTTILRDLIRQISRGSEYGPGYRVGVVDERSELASCYRGVAQMDLGTRTDVIDNCPKSLGMEWMIRSMAPEILAVDELGKEEDVEAVIKAKRCGIKVLASIHGATRKDVWERGLTQVFDVFVILGREKGRPYIMDHWERGEYDQVAGRSNGDGRMSGNGNVVYWHTGKKD